MSNDAYWNQGQDMVNMLGGLESENMQANEIAKSQMLTVFHVSGDHMPQDFDVHIFNEKDRVLDMVKDLLDDGELGENINIEVAEMSRFDFNNLPVDG